MRDGSNWALFFLLWIIGDFTNSVMELSSVQITKFII